MATGIVLAGGHSSRLGHDKASALLAGRPLLQHVLDRLDGVIDAVVVVCRPAQVLPSLSTPLALRIVTDAYPDAGPLGGLYTGLVATTTPAALAVACDMPLLRPALLRQLLRLLPGHDAVVPQKDGLLQPLCAAYAPACASSLQARLEAGLLRLTDAVAPRDDNDALRTLVLTPEAWQRFDADGVSFANLNRAEDFERAATLLAREG